MPSAAGNGRGGKAVVFFRPIGRLAPLPFDFVHRFVFGRYLPGGLNSRGFIAASRALAVAFAAAVAHHRLLVGIRVLIIAHRIDPPVHHTKCKIIHI